MYLENLVLKKKGLEWVKKKRDFDISMLRELYGLENKEN